MRQADPKCWACAGTGLSNGGRGCPCGDARCLHNRCGCTIERHPKALPSRVVTSPGAAIKVTEIDMPQAKGLQ